MQSLAGTASLFPVADHAGHVRPLPIRIGLAITSWEKRGDQQQEQESLVQRETRNREIKHLRVHLVPRLNCVHRSIVHDRVKRAVGSQRQEASVMGLTRKGHLPKDLSLRRKCDDAVFEYLVNGSFA